MTQDIEISSERNRLDISYVHRVLRTHYWAEGIPESMVRKSINNSLCFGVYKKNKQIGFARVVTDFTIFAYLADVFIDQHEQRKGYAKKLFEEILADERFKQIRRWHLLTRDAQKFYEQFGFTNPVDPTRHMEKITQPNYSAEE